jgi:hypothetical protein
MAEGAPPYVTSGVSLTVSRYAINTQKRKHFTCLLFHSVC